MAPKALNADGGVCCAAGTTGLWVVVFLVKGEGEGDAVLAWW